MSVCGCARMHTNTHLHTCMCVLGPEVNVRNLFSITIHLIFLRYALSFKLELRDKARLTGHEAPGIHLSLHAPFLALGLQACLRDLNSGLHVYVASTLSMRHV